MRVSSTLITIDKNRLQMIQHKFVHHGGTEAACIQADRKTTEQRLDELEDTNKKILKILGIMQENSKG